MVCCKTKQKEEEELRMCNNEKREMFFSFGVPPLSGVHLCSCHDVVIVVLLFVQPKSLSAVLYLTRQEAHRIAETMPQFER